MIQQLCHWQFAVPGDDGKAYTGKDFLGSGLVLYFYPKDLTPGCTIQAKAFAQLYDDFDAINTRVVGVSKDQQASHERFKQTCDLPFLLLSDTQLELAKAMDVWVEKSMFGKRYMGMNRATFLFNPQGILVEHWPKVKVNGHGDTVYQAAKTMMSDASI